MYIIILQVLILERYSILDTKIIACATVVVILHSANQLTSDIIR